MALLMSRRARRMQNHHQRNQQKAGLNLVSLMDIFTILVFFLLVNASEVEILPSPKHIQLPLSLAEQMPEETVVVTVSNEHILIDGQTAVDSDTLANGDWRSALTSQLQTALAAIPPRVTEATEEQQNQAPAITVMGDKSVPFARIRQIMQACGAAGFGKVSLAVEKMIDGPDIAEVNG